MNEQKIVVVRIPGPPLAQGRGRVGRTKSGHSVVYDPEKSRSWKGAAQQHMAVAAKALDWKPSDSPVTVLIEALFPCPKSDYRKREPRPVRWHTKANGDIDNVEKAVLDAGNGILWIDDRSVVSISAFKVIAAQGQPPEVRVSLAHAGSPPRWLT